MPKTGNMVGMEGDFYVFEESKHNTMLISNQVDQVVPVNFTLSPDGKYSIPDTSHYPLTRDFPVFPKKALEIGEKWQEYGVRYVEPFKDGVFTKVRFYCDYTYEGEKEYKGTRFKLITAQYALRYKQGDDPKGDKRLDAITNAGHKVEIYFDLEKKKPVFMKDLIIENLGGEVYKFKDGTTVVNHGFTQTWFDIIEQLDRDKTIKDVKEEIAKGNIPDVTVENKGNGVSLTLNNIHFVADKDIILPSETPRLDALYDTLSKIKGRTFLVIGHTAKAGTEKEQYELSVTRAKSIVDYMINKGMDAKRFLYQGKGSTEPVAPNDSELNMSKNRRVEIVIMED